MDMDIGTGLAELARCRHREDQITDRDTPPPRPPHQEHRRDLPGRHRLATGRCS